METKLLLSKRRQKSRGIVGSADRIPTFLLASDYVEGSVKSSLQRHQMLYTRFTAAFIAIECESNEMTLTINECKMKFIL